MTEEIERSLELIRAWEKYREGVEFELEQVRRRAKMLKADIDYAGQQIRRAINADETQLVLDGMDDVGFPPDRASWRDAPLEVVLGKGVITNKLGEKSITKLGELADFTERNGSLITHVGLTEQQEASVINAMQVYWGQPDADN